MGLPAGSSNDAAIAGSKGGVGKGAGKGKGDGKGKQFPKKPKKQSLGSNLS